MSNASKQLAHQQHVHKTQEQLIERAKDPKWLEQWQEHRWMNIGDTSQIETVSPWAKRTEYDIANPDVFLLDLLRKPDNFGFTCDVLFNKYKQLVPFQIAILRELWTRPFPMLIGSRGLGKSFILALYAVLRALFEQGRKIVIVGAAFRQAKVVFDYCNELWEDSPILRDIVGTGGRNGPRRDVDRCSLRLGESLIQCFPLGDGSKIRGQRASIVLADEFACLGPNTLVETDKGLMRIAESEAAMGSFLLAQPDGAFIVPNAFIKTPPTETYEVISRSGYSFTCSSIHKVMTTNGWKLAKDLTTDDYLTLNCSDYWPNEPISVDGLRITNDVAWLLGTLVSEGSVNHEYTMSVSSTDMATIAKTKRLLCDVTKNKVGENDKPAYIDPRGWQCKASRATYCTDLALRNKLVKLGLARTTSHNKTIPWCILQSPREQVVSFLSGLFDGDGSAFLWSSRGRDNHLGVAYYSVNEQLVSEVQVLLLKFGVVSNRLPRDSEISDNLQWMLRINGKHAHSLANLLDIPKWKSIVDAACPAHDRENTGVVWDKSRNKWQAYIWLNGKRKFLGRFATKEQAISVVDEATPETHLQVRSVTKLEDKQVLYDYHVPGTNTFIGAGFTQHNSIPVDIFETVVRGFGAVSADPVMKMVQEYRKIALQELGLWTPAHEQLTENQLTTNQTVISGTASYSFNHYYDYFKRYKGFIESRGDPNKLKEIFGDHKPDPNFNWRDYSIIRIPASILPPKFMDAKMLAQAKATVHSGTYGREYGAIFATDSNGFFRRSLIESCVVGTTKNPIDHQSCGVVIFNAMLRGNLARRYVIAVDPASERDNFCIVILELHNDHRRIVHCWTTTRSRFKAKAAKGLTDGEDDYYAYAARKIRDLMKKFPTERLAIDSQGGGIAIIEALQDKKKMKEGEKPIYPFIDPENQQDSDGLAGDHILDVVQFAKSEWVAAANHGMKKDFEDKVLLFPEFNTAILGMALLEDKEAGRIVVDPANKSVERLYDTLEDVALEIEDLKEELATIVHTQTGQNLRDHWSTPETKLEGGKKGRLRKDRYSALLMANMTARVFQVISSIRADDAALGGFAQHNLQNRGAANPNTLGSEMYIGPAWWTEGANRTYAGTLLRRS